jgi:hypothetical protein
MACGASADAELQRCEILGAWPDIAVPAGGSLRVGDYPKQYAQATMSNRHAFAEIR